MINIFKVINEFNEKFTITHSINDIEKTKNTILNKIKFNKAPRKYIELKDSAQKTDFFIECLKFELLGTCEKSALNNEIQKFYKKFKNNNLEDVNNLDIKIKNYINNNLIDRKYLLTLLYKLN